MGVWADSSTASSTTCVGTVALDRLKLVGVFAFEEEGGSGILLLAIVGIVLFPANNGDPSEAKVTN